MKLKHMLVFCMALFLSEGSLYANDEIEEKDKDRGIVRFMNACLKFAGISWTYDMDPEECQAILEESQISPEFAAIVNAFEDAVHEFGEALWNRDFTLNYRR